MKRLLRLSFISVFFILLSFSGQAKKAKEDLKKSKKKAPMSIKKILDMKAVQAIHKRQGRRRVLIGKYKAKGFIGEREDGLLAIRTLKKLPDSEKKEIKKLLDRENRDRNQLYEIISRASRYNRKEEKRELRFDMFKSHLSMDPRNSYYFQDRKWHRK